MRLGGLICQAARGKLSSQATDVSLLSLCLCKLAYYHFICRWLRK